MSGAPAPGGGQPQGAPAAGPGPSGVAPSAHPRPGAPGRSSAEIRADIAAQQRELATSMDALRSRVTELTDWRKQLDDHREQLVKGAVVTGFVVGGILALRAFSRRR